jgi:hypothetical protein
MLSLFDYYPAASTQRNFHHPMSGLTNSEKVKGYFADQNGISSSGMSSL